MSNNSIFVLSLIFSLVSCSGVSAPLLLPALSEQSSLGQDNMPCTFFIKSISDQRTEKSVILYEGQSFRFDADPGPSIREGLTNGFLASGCSESRTPGAYLMVSIKSWKANFEPGIIKGLGAKAELELKVFDDKANLRLISKYFGQSQVSTLIVDNEKVQEALALSMREVISAINSDSRVKALLFSEE